MEKTSNRKLGYFFILMTTIIFSTAEPIFKTVGGNFNPVQFVSTRFFFGGLVLLPFALSYLKKKGIGFSEQSKVRITKSDVIELILCGLLNVTISMTLYQWALSLIPASAAAVLLCTNPVTTTFIAYLLIKEPITKNKIIMIVLSIIGVLIIIDPLNQSLDSMGLILMMLTVITFSLYSVIGKKSTIKLGGIAANSFTSIIGGVTTFIVIFMTNIPAVGNFMLSVNMEKFAFIDLFQGYSWSIMPIVLWIWVVNTGIGFLCYFKGMELTSATEASIVFLLKITIGPIISMIFLKEVISLNLALGMVLTTIGTLVVLLPGLKDIFRQRKDVSELNKNAAS
ncbi:DMT family transporter [Neobacillus sp. FSL H8-0543]|uniref:DMT family transporter n=1 Tax=Neobacillus sp. FSL H8-0543 TaxID=2954672 RepID=UPI003158F96D